MRIALYSCGKILRSEIDAQVTTSLVYTHQSLWDLYRHMLLGQVIKILLRALKKLNLSLLKKKLFSLQSISLYLKVISFTHFIGQIGREVEAEKNSPRRTGKGGWKLTSYLWGRDSSYCRTRKQEKNSGGRVARR